LVMGLLVVTIGQAETDSAAGLDQGAMERAIGKSGEMKDGVYKVSLPRKDLVVVVNGVKIRPGLALGTWLAFKENSNDVVMDGDLVLQEEEVGPVIERLHKEGIQVTAVHNHLIGETPRVMYVHVFAKGDGARLAKQMKEVLALTSTPTGPAVAKNEGLAKGAGEEPGFDVELVQKQLGKGKVQDGVLSISLSRPEKIQMQGATLTPSMGMATAINVQAAGEKSVAATGDFVLIAEEVNPVTKALTDHGMLITALHNHLVHGSPDLYFMHFWATGSADHVTKGLKAAVGAMQLR
jgi:hypothetical protein